MSRRRLAVAVLVLMGLAFLAYAILHSPLRHRIDRLFGAPPGCTVLCGHTSQMLGRLDVLFFLAAALVAAWAVVSVIGLRSWERPAAWGLVAFAFVSVPAAIVGEAASLAHSHLLRPPYGPLIASLPALVAIWLLYRRGWRPAMPRIGIRPIAPLVALMAIPVFGLMAISIGVAVSHPPTGYDELGYHAPLAVFYWRSGDLSSFMDAIPGKFTLAHPGSAELLFGALRLIAGEPAAILGQLPFALLGAAGVAAFARRLGLSAGACAVAAVIFLGAPIVALQVGRQASDVVGASLIIVVAALAAAPPEEWSIGRAALIGLGLGVAAVTKLALIPLVFALVLVVLGTLIIRARRSGKNRPEAESPFTRRQALISLAVLAGCFLVAVAPWWIRNVMLFGNPIYPAAIPLIGRGVSFGEGQPAKDLVNVPHTWLWPLYPLFEPLTHASGMGAAFAIGIVPGALAAAVLARRRPLVILLVLVVVGIPAWWAFSRHEPRFPARPGRAGSRPGAVHAACGAPPLACLGRGVADTRGALHRRGDRDGRPVGRCLEARGQAGLLRSNVAHRPGSDRAPGGDRTVRGP